jgi:hypothetical protein
MIWDDKKDYLITYAFSISVLGSGFLHAVFDHIDLTKDAIVENITREIEDHERKEIESKEKSEKESVQDQNAPIPSWWDYYYYYSEEKIA